MKPKGSPIKRLLLIFLAIFVAIPSTLRSQTIIWSEDFSSYSNGTTSDPGGKWTTTCVGCTMDASSFFEVQSNAYEGQNTDADGIWTSEWIDISAYQKVDLSMEIEGDNSNGAGDYCIAEYSTDGGTSFSTFSNGDQDGLAALTAVAVAQLTNADSVMIRVTLQVNNTNEQYRFDNIFVVGVNDHAGSGYRLDFDGVNGSTTGDVVELDNNFPNLITGDFTIAAWVNSDNVSQAGQRIFCDDETNGTNGFSFSLGDGGSGRLRFYIRGTSGVILDVTNSSYFLNSNEWYHVAITHNATSNARAIYVNGMLAASDTYTGSTNSPDGVAAIGGEPSTSGETGNRFNGEIDEVSFWNFAMTTTQIRDIMCKKADVNNPNLIAYYKFDDGAGYAVRDELDNYVGRMTNMAPATDWDYSGAAVGDTGIYNYTGSWSGISIVLQSLQNDSFVVSSVAGSPNGVHVYNVLSVPDDTSGANGIGGNDEYFGVFKAFGTSPTYTGTYYYRNNDAYQSGILDEGSMVLFSRTDNAATWSQAGASLDTVSKTLTLTGESTEYILGNSYAPLPVTLLTFKASTFGDVVILNWETLSEINNDYFEIERSIDAFHFRYLGMVPGSGNSRDKTSYAYSDENPLSGISYYRLKQVDFNGSLMYSGISAVNLGQSGSDIRVFPNPNRDHHLFVEVPVQAERSVLELNLTDISGDLRWKEQMIVSQSDQPQVITVELPEINGVFILSIEEGNELLHQTKIILE